jgi:hypothetical protein
MESFQKKSTRYLLSVLLVFTLLVATHKGEFWPLSIYPMFSQAGNPWTRALVRDVSTTPDSLKWETTDLEGLNGNPVALQKYGVDQIDFANFISKTDTWTPERKRALQVMFGKENIKDRELMVMKVHGRLVGDDSVTVQAVPLLLVTAENVVADSSSTRNKTMTAQ